jgi:hypothetical protein
MKLKKIIKIYKNVIKNKPILSLIKLINYIYNIGNIKKIYKILPKLFAKWVYDIFLFCYLSSPIKDISNILCVKY